VNRWWGNASGSAQLRQLSILFALFFALVGVGTAGAQVTAGVGVDYEVLSTDAKDPLFIQVAPDGRVFWVEREGRIEVLKPDGTQANVGTIPISANACDETYCPKEVASLEEGGLYSILLDKDFAKTGKVFMYYSVPNSFRPGDQDKPAGNAYDHDVVCREPSCEVAPNFGKWRLSTFTIGADSKLVPDSEHIILENPVEWLHCCHHGGDLEWMPDGTLLLTTGDDIAATAASYGQTTDPMEGNAENSAQNPSDRRGKILRLNPDGSVPDGSVPGVKANPFLVTDANGVAQRDADGHVVTKEVKDPYIPVDRWGDPNDKVVPFDPYVYSMGYKQPFRGIVHPYSGRAIFGEVGPDGYAPDPKRGPRGLEEINEIPYGGGTNHGWPRCSGPNDPYHEYDYKTQTAGPAFDCSKMDPSVLWYPHDVSAQWPLLGAGLVTSIPAAFYPADQKGAMRLPAAFNDNLIYMEFSRHSVIAMPVTKDGHLVTDQSKWTIVAPPQGANALGLLPSNLPITPIDATVGPDGAIYFLEYGNSFYNGSNGKVSRLKCSGCTDALSKARERVSTPVQTAGPSGLPTWPIVALAAGLLLLVPVLRRRRLVK
jgi:glucose/arabinose dehydrogenase